VAHTWCPNGNVGDYNSILFYPQGPPPDNTVAADTDVLAATTSGNHILGAATSGGDITLSDIGLTIPQLNCLPPEDIGTPPAPNPDYALALGDPFYPLALQTTLTTAQITAAAAAVNQVVPSPASDLAFITYTPSTDNTTSQLPYYVPGSGGAPGRVGYVTLMNGSSTSTTVTAPIAGAFSPDNTLFFVSTAGDNQIHYISVPTLTDTQQIAPFLPACLPVSQGGVDKGCVFSGTGTIVPATAIGVKPRSTT
jgi:hypothetical protein